MADDVDLTESVELAIGGTLFAGWTSVSVTRSLDALSGSFTLDVADRDAAGVAPFPIAPTDRCQLRIGGEPVIDGWVDAVNPSLTAEDHAISVTGRDRTCDLVDCSAIHKPGSWRRARIEAIAAELARPFGIAVDARVSTGAPIDRFAIQQGETVQAAFERLLRFRGLLAVPTATGDVAIITPDEGAPVATIAAGVNIVGAQGGQDFSERFSDYIVKGQASGSDDRNGRTVAQIRGEARDADVKRYRPLLVVAEDQSDGVSAGARARWEAGVRAGKSLSIEVDVLGWRIATGGALWRPNLPVRLRAPAMQVADAAMLVTAVTLKRDAGGTIATLTLMPPGAWRQLKAGAK